MRSDEPATVCLPARPVPAHGRGLKCIPSCSSLVSPSRFTGERAAVGNLGNSVNSERRTLDEQPVGG